MSKPFFLSIYQFIMYQNYQNLSEWKYRNQFIFVLASWSTFQPFFYNHFGNLTYYKMCFVILYSMSWHKLLLITVLEQWEMVDFVSISCFLFLTRWRGEIQWGKFVFNDFESFWISPFFMNMISIFPECEYGYGELNGWILYISIFKV